MTTKLSNMFMPPFGINLAKLSGSDIFINNDGVDTAVETIYKLFYDRQKFSGNNTAIIFDGISYSYRDLYLRTEKLAAGFYDVGIRKGTVVGVLFPNSLDIIAVFYALLRLGAVPALLNYRLSGNELNMLIEKAKCEHLIYSTCYSPLVQVIHEQDSISLCYISDDRAEKRSLVDILSHYEAKLDYQPDLSPDDPALYLFTGGTLSLPKIVCITQETLFLRTALRFISGNVDYTETDNYLLFNPIFHQGGISQVMFMLSAGGCLTILPEMRPEKIARAISNYKVTIMILLPPSLCSRLKENPALLKYDRSSVRLITLTGGSTSDQSIYDIFEMFPNAKLCIGYGHTEDAANTNHIFTREDFAKNPKIGRSIGKQHAFWEMRLVDEHGQIVPVGETGECIARSRCMLKEYLGRETFDKDGWLHTGDLLCMDEDGYYYFRGRCNDMIKSGGENVLAVEVEQVINSHPEIVKCAVFGVNGGDLGEMIWAAAVKTAGSRLDETTLIEYVKCRIARYKAPKRVFYLNELATTSIGKLDKKAIKKYCLELSGEDYI